MSKSQKKLHYFFEPVLHCAMCGDDVKKHKLIGQRLNQSQGLRPKKKHGISTSVFCCKQCGLIYSNPLPIPENIQDHYNISPEEYWQSEKAINQDNFSNEIEKIKKLITIKKGMRSLDIGAGLGHTMISLANAGFDSYGIEPSWSFREAAIMKMNIDPEKLKEGKIEEVNFPENYFDLIVFNAVLEHLYNPGTAIQKAIKWLKNDGIIQITVPSSSWLIAKLFNAFFRLAGTNYVTNLSPMHIPYHLFEFDINSFKKHSIRWNYKIIFYEYFVCDLKPIPIFFHPILRWYMKKTNKGMVLSVWLRKNL